MNELKKVIYEKLEEILEIPVYHENANGSLPYAVFNVNIIDNSFDRYLMELIINLYYSGSGSGDIDDAVLDVVEGLKFYTYADENVGFSLRPDGVNSIPTGEQESLRREIRFQMLNYFKGV